MSATPDSVIVYSAAEVAHLAHVPVHVVHQKAAAGRMPPYILIGKRRYWTREHLFAAVSAAREPPLDDAA